MRGETAISGWRPDAQVCAEIKTLVIFDAGLLLTRSPNRVYCVPADIPREPISRITGIEQREQVWPARSMVRGTGNAAAAATLRGTAAYRPPVLGTSAGHSFAVKTATRGAAPRPPRSSAPSRRSQAAASSSLGSLPESSEAEPPREPPGASRAAASARGDAAPLLTAGIRAAQYERSYEPAPNIPSERVSADREKAATEEARAAAARKDHMEQLNLAATQGGVRARVGAPAQPVRHESSEARIQAARELRYKTQLQLVSQRSAKVLERGLAAAAALQRHHASHLRALKHKPWLPTYCEARGCWAG